MAFTGDIETAGGAVNALIAHIYAGVLELPFADFKERTLARVRTAIAFSSGVWASGAYSSNTMHSVSLLNHQPEMLMDYVAHWQDRDFVRAAVVAAPGKAFRNEDIVPLADFRQSAIYLQFCRPAGLEHALGVVDADLARDLGELLFLFRDDPDAPFTDEEVARLELLLPHLTTAWRQRQALHRYETGNPAEFGASGQAVIDDQGLLCAVEARFSELLRAAFPHWTGPRLPPDAARALRDGVARAGHLEFRLIRGEGRHVLSARRLGDDGLTSAESKVAHLFAGGRSNRDVAAELGVSPATVRNQLASIYRKLDIHSKTELARLFPPDAKAPGISPGEG